MKKNNLYFILLIVIISIIFLLFNYYNSLLKKTTGILPEDSNKDIIFSENIDDWNMFGGNQKLQRRTCSIFDSAIDLIWSYNIPEGITTPVLYKNKLIVIGFYGRIFIFDLESNEPYDIINACTEPVSSPPLILNDNIIFGTMRGNLYSISLQNKEINWIYNAKGKITGTPNYYYLENEDVPNIIFGCYAGNIYSLSSKSGELKLLFETNDFINGSVAIAHEYNIAVFGGCDGKLRIIDLIKEREIFNYNLDSYIPSSPLITNNKIISVGYSNTISAFSIKPPYENLWTYKNKNTRSNNSYSPAVSDIYLAIGDRNGNVKIIDKQTGELVIQKNFNYEIFSILFYKNAIVITNDNGNIYALDKKTFEIIWKYDCGIPFIEGIIPVGKGFAVSDYDGTLYFFQ